MEKSNKMLIDATHPEETRVVVLRNGRVEEFDYESAARKLLRGNIYLAKVTRVEPSLQAAFVDYGGNRHGFLAFSEIHPDYYQIPVADRQAPPAEEAEAEGEAEAEADARAEAEEARSPHEQQAARHSQGRYRAPPSDDQPDEPAESREALPEAAAPDDRLQEPVSVHAPESETPQAAAPPSQSSEDAHPHNHGDNGHGSVEAPSEARGNGHVEDIGSDQAEAPETVSTVEQVGSEDALEEGPERPRRRIRSYKIQEGIKPARIIPWRAVNEDR